MLDFNLGKGKDKMVNKERGWGLEGTRGVIKERNISAAF
jgi:hypothetical protein